MEDKWKSLLREVQINPSLVWRGAKPHCCTSEIFFEFEHKSGFSFPEEFRFFCQIFGRGRFGNDWILISRCPAAEDLNEQLDDDVDIIETLKLQFEGSADTLSILNQSYYFGCCNQVSFLFTKEVVEGQPNFCHRIYAMDDNGNFYNMGIDFFQFVKKYCLGEGIGQDFPQLLKFMVPAGRNKEQMVLNAFTSI
ncbi:MAG: SMI1/KNR4 family protein [Leptolyngbyaceae cyanobacterium]